jgi:hypothetical protein
MPFEDKSTTLDGFASELTSPTLRVGPGIIRDASPKLVNPALLGEAYLEISNTGV